MSLKIRLQKTGKRDTHFYRIAVMEQRSKRDGRANIIGHVNAQIKPPLIVVDRKKLEYWLSKGALPSQAAKKLLSV